MSNCKNARYNVIIFCLWSGNEFLAIRKYIHTYDETYHTYIYIIYICTIKRHADAFFDYMLDSHHESYNFISISKTISANVTRFIPLVDILFTTKTYSESFSFPFSVLLTYFRNHWDLQKCYLWANIWFEFVFLFKIMVFEL